VIDKVSELLVDKSSKPRFAVKRYGGIVYAMQDGGCLMVFGSGPAL
jgi:hypothetical protein